MWVPTDSWRVNSANLLVDWMTLPVLAANLSMSATRSRRKPMFSPSLVPREPNAYGSEACSIGRPFGLVTPCTIATPGVRMMALAIRSKEIMSVVLRMS